MLNLRAFISIIILVVCCILQNVRAQDSTNLGQDLSFQITKLEVAPKIDGNIDTQEWEGAVLIDQAFVQYEPEFGAPSPFRTVVRIGQTETALYVAFESYDPDIARISAARTQRDGGLGRDDSVAVLFDTFFDQRTAYLFRTNVLATQQDSRIADNGRNVDTRWDAAWRGRPSSKYLCRF